MDARAARAARNESLFREVNERIEEAGLVERDRSTRFLCECADTNCTEMIELPVEEYEAVRAKPDRFLVMPGHEIPDIEQVVEVRPSYLIIEKIGPARAVAEELDPRRPPP